MSNIGDHSFGDPLFPGTRSHRARCCSEDIAPILGKPSGAGGIMPDDTLYLIVLMYDYRLDCW